MTTQQQNRGHDRSNRAHQHTTPPVTGVESDHVKRAALLGFGALLLLQGLRRRSVRGLGMALTGGAILAYTLLGDTGGGGTDSTRTVSRRSNTEPTTSVSVSRSATIGKPPDELYEAWRDPEVFSRVMGQFAEVTASGENRHSWTVDGPAETNLSWETEIVESNPGEVLRWETPDDASVSNSGSVRFRPAADDRGTLVTLSLTFEPPGGKLASATLEKLDIVPETLAGHILGRFKSLVESGEIPTLERNPSGRGEGDLM